jgi:4-hydroxy-tetrahydrodipicolinate reductase
VPDITRHPLPVIGVVGRGRLGRAVADACARHGRPAALTAGPGGWRTPGGATVLPEVIVDASAPAAHDAVREQCERYGAALVECVSDLDDGQWRALADLAGKVPVVRATNLTIGHYVQRRFVEWLAASAVSAVLPPEAAVHERHPAAKAHRPSATAVELSRTWTAGSGTPVAETSSLRAGPPVSDHEVLWTWPGEALLLRHSVRDLAAAATGALAAARWAAGRGPGLVTMRTVYDDLTGGRPADRTAALPASRTTNQE